jgi:hypothetical protein
MMHKQVVYDVIEVRSGLWAYKYAISANIKKGELDAASRAVAVKKVQQLIRRDLRIKHIQDRGGVVQEMSPSP